MSGSFFKRKRLGDCVAGLGFAKREDVEKAAECPGARIGKRLVDQGLISEKELAVSLAEHFEMPYEPLDNVTVPDSFFEKHRVDDIYRLGILPCAEKNGNFVFAVDDPINETLISEIERLYGAGTEYVISSPQAIRASLDKSGSASRFLKSVSTEYQAEKNEEDNNDEMLLTIGDMAGMGPSVEKFVNTILLVAMKKRASDIHFESYEKGVTVKYRIDGILYGATERLDTAHHRALITRLKVMAKMDIAENRVPQDGHFTLNIGGRDTDFRVSILPAVHGEDVVIRILDKSAFEHRMKNLSLETLGFESEILASFRQSIREPYGMVLITGPTGSGKTTTLYAALAEINTQEEKIITVEDPVEYQIEGIVQVPVNEKKKLTFAAGLRSILRHDPDKIVVGEIRDSETAQIAVQSALTGHLVFTTVHANSACDVIGRFGHMGINIHSFVSALNCVVAQRLLRNICPNCREKLKKIPDEWVPADLSREDIVSNEWFAGKGCDKCAGTGYLGRSAIAEYMTITPVIRRMISEHRQASELQAAAEKEGMITLRNAALKRALKGETTLREANRVTFAEAVK